VFGGEDTLLKEQPAAVGNVMEVVGVTPTDWRVTVNAKPEHGAAGHSFAPELSIVETSTTPGPLAAPMVHAPVWAEPLTQIFVNEGVAINVPRAALVGSR
jgi:hypothetical protein